MCCANNYGLWKNFTKQNEDHYTDNGQAIQQQEHQVCTLAHKIIIYKSRGEVHSGPYYLAWIKKWFPGWLDEN